MELGCDFAVDSPLTPKPNCASQGRDINAYSFFPHEGEILLSPSARFTVSSEPRTEGSFVVIDLVQAAGNTFVS